MKIKLICVGKTISKYLIEGEVEYLSRLKHYCNIEKIEIPELKNAKKMRQDQIKKEEGRLILSKIALGEQVILLDEGGKTHTSIEFSKYLQKRLNQGGKSIVFIVGGAYGFSEEVYSKSSGKISLSDMTFSHQMVRLFFLEQLYRGFTILKGEPYHHN
ncbi:MAG: 23S rRNA (pseudouridine(1915)-N(3))-methyltransferase RlmH [Crocinitomicaceae bacterium]|nr:23S rRNA (pseudouridine(1915)-N(3))-methyltransferase RlmH [Crocinitomicaceae bacterium]MDG1657710.1 23S rRNA (pseudouridine(1915)-N(3))-methyltransferase RlmH [Crocinitomicaceae bacterium]|tara:strand:+ start:6947 stop:7420 length:474 start_codon:yes stop_codon:yes gene_type:complete